MRSKTSYELSAAEMAVLDLYFERYCTPPLRMAEASDADSVGESFNEIFEATRTAQGKTFIGLAEGSALSRPLPLEITRKISDYAFSTSDLSPRADDQLPLLSQILLAASYHPSPLAFSAIMSPAASLASYPDCFVGDKEKRVHFCLTLSAAQIYLLDKAIKSTPAEDQATLVNQLFEQLATTRHSTLEVLNYFISTSLLSPEHLNQLLSSYLHRSQDTTKIMIEDGLLDAYEIPRDQSWRYIFQLIPNLLRHGASLPENYQLETMLLPLLLEGNAPSLHALEFFIQASIMIYVLRDAGQGTFDMNRRDVSGNTLAGALQVWVDGVTFTCFNEMLQILQNTGAPPVTADAASPFPTIEAINGLQLLLGQTENKELASYWQFLKSQPELDKKPELRILLLKLYVALDPREHALPPAITAFLEADSRALAAAIPSLTSDAEDEEDYSHGPGGSASSA